MPGTRSVCTVTMKLRPVMIDEKPMMKMPRMTGAASLVVVVEYGV